MLAMPKRGDMGTAGPLDAGSPLGQLQVGDGGCPGMLLRGGALVWGARKSVVPGEHWRSKQVAVGDSALGMLSPWYGSGGLATRQDFPDFRTRWGTC